MNLSAGIHVKIRIKQEIYWNKLGKVKEKKNLEWLLLYLHFSLKNVTMDQRKSKMH